MKSFIEFLIVIGFIVLLPLLAAVGCIAFPIILVVQLQEYLNENFN